MEPELVEEIKPVTINTGETIQIPELKSSVVNYRIEMLYVAFRYWFLRFFLIWKYFGHPFKTIEVINQLLAVRRKILGDHKLTKLIKVDGKYYFAMNGPGIFSNGFPRYYQSEINRIYKKKPQTELRVVLFAITKKCGYKCEHCYEWDNLSNQDVLNINDIATIIKRFQERGVGQIQFGGGEPMSRYRDILRILKEFSGKSDFTIVSSGFQLTRERAQKLKENGLTSITISLDHFEPEKHDRFRGFPGAFDWAIRAVENAKSANLVVNLSLCATREFVDEDNMMKYAELAKRLGIAFIWILEPRAVGHYKGMDVQLSKEQIPILNTFYEELNFNKKYRHYPAVAYPAYHQRRVGCMGSGNRFLYIDTDGNMKSCPMCGSAHGNAATDDIGEAIKSMQAVGCTPFPDASI